MKKDKCCGCQGEMYQNRDNYKCWHYDTAKIVWRVPIGHWETPPYIVKCVRIPNCYRRGNQGTHYIEKEKFDSRGYLS